ncbi:MAG: phosphatidate cytidylyltransferase [Solirubrobacterales bacterium]|nr:phosphatidate cytidylyltransferase [Solirubrobacterales bacterium]
MSAARSRRAPAGRRPRSGQRAARPRRPRSDLPARILVAIPAAIVAIAFVDIGGLVFALFLVAVALVCLHELYGMLARWRPAAAAGFAATAGMVLAAHFGTERTVLEVAVAALPVAFLAVLAATPGGTPTVSVAGTLLGVYWIGFAFAHAELLRGVDHGNAVLIDVMIGTFLADTGAYLGGRLFGRRLLAPGISPNKTVEGLLCGVLVAIVTLFVAGLYETWMTQGDSLLLGLAVAILGPLGDLFESLVKRDAGVKDSGRLFGAHGGGLDRLDALIFTVVAGYYVWIGVMH